MHRIAHYLSRLREERRPLKFLLSRLLWRTGLGHRLGLKIRCERYRLHFFPTSLSASYWLDPTARAHDEAFLESYLEPGNVMVDVGANIGTLALCAAVSVGDSGSVFAIEAHPVTFRYLAANVALNGARNLTIFNLAAGSGEGVVTFSDKGLDDQNEVTSGNGIPVRCTTLDQLLAGRMERVHLLKIDVEGFEKYVLEGATELLKRTDCVYFESWENHFVRHGYTTRDVIELLEASGFRTGRLVRGGLEPLPPGYVSRRLEDLIAVRDPEEFSRRVSSRTAPGL